MRTKMGLSLAAFLSFIVIFPVSAQVLAPPAPSSNLTEIRDLADELKKRRDEMMEMMKAKRDEFRERLQTIRDEKKKLIVQRIDAKMADVNQRTTARFTAVLEKLQSILNRIIGKANDLKTKGIDTTAFDSATVPAQMAIDNAKAAVASQAANLYVIQIASESALKSNVGSTVSQLRQNLREVHKAIVDAKQAVQKVVMEYAKLKKDRMIKSNEATGSSR